MRLRSEKRVLEKEECCHKYKAVFTESNCPLGFVISINGERKVYPLNEEVEITEPEYLMLKLINKGRKILPQLDYDPFED